MRKKILFFFVSIFLLVLLNMKVKTRLGMDYRVFTIELPLYLKVFNFYDRHLNYKHLVKRIVGQLETEEEKVFRLFQWINETIRRQPEDLLVRDDHVWNVYIRGYGVSDNFHDLFTTLCNYIGVNAFFETLYNASADKNENHEIHLSFIQVQRGWVVFDPFNGVYFTNKDGDWSTVEEIKNKNWKLVKLKPTDISASHYKPYLEEIPVIKDMGLRRANIQSPINRLRFELEKLF